MQNLREWTYISLPWLAFAMFFFISFFFLAFFEDIDSTYTSKKYLTGLFFNTVLLSFGSASGGDVSLNPKNRLDAKSIRFFLKLSRPIQVPVVGHRNRVHSQVFHLIKQSVHAIAAVKKGILRMKVQVREFGHR